MCTLQAVFLPDGNSSHDGIVRAELFDLSGLTYLGAIEFTTCCALKRKNQDHAVSLPSEVVKYILFTQ